MALRDRQPKVTEILEVDYDIALVMTVDAAAKKIDLLTSGSSSAIFLRGHVPIEQAGFWFCGHMFPGHAFN